VASPIEDNIDRLIRRLQRRGLSTPTSNLYAEGIKGKFRLARHCIEVLDVLEHLDEPTFQLACPTLTSQISLDTDDLVLFYCESFWHILRSSIDILAQLINELWSLGVSEHEVYFNTINNRIKATASTSQLGKALHSLERSRMFKVLNGYRRCCTHRRQVFVQKDRQDINYSTMGTPGYNYVYLSSQTTIINRYLCNNPWDVNLLVDRT